MIKKYLRFAFWLLLSAYLLVFALGLWSTVVMAAKIGVALALGLAGSRLWDSGKLLIVSLRERRKYQKLIDEAAGSFRPEEPAADWPGTDDPEKIADLMMAAQEEQAMATLDQEKAGRSSDTKSDDNN